MSAPHTAPQHRQPGPAAPSTVRLGAGRLVHSEWVKFRSIRSTFWCYGVLAVLVIGIAAALGALADPGDDATGDAGNSFFVTMNTLSVYLAALVVSVLGVLIITGEFATGQIRSTFTAAPDRVGVLLAKATVLAVSTFVVSLVSTWIGALLSTALQAGKGVPAHLADPAVAMPLLGTSVALTLLALLAFGIGLLIRSSAGGIAIAVGVLVVLPIVLSVFAALANTQWVSDIGAFLPYAAGSQLYQYASGSELPSDGGGGVTLNGWSGGGVLLAEVVVVNALAIIVARRRDV
jgi:ABC-2 type transport system permease protein